MKKLFVLSLSLVAATCSPCHAQQPTLQQRPQFQFIPAGTASNAMRFLGLNAPNGNAATASEMKEFTLASLFSADAGNGIAAGTDGLLFAPEAVPVTVTDGNTVDLTLTGQDITAEVTGAAAAANGTVLTSDGAGGVTWTATHAAATVTDSATIDLTLTGQNITAGIIGAGAAAVGQVPASDGSGGITWTTPLSSVVTASPIVGDGSAGTPIDLIDGGSAGDVLQWDGTDWQVISPAPVDTIYTANGTLTGNRLVNGGGFDFDFANVGDVIFNATDIFNATADRMRLAGVTEVSISTPAVDAATATAGQVLTLTNAATGEVEYQTAIGATKVTVAITAAATSVTVAIPAGKTADELVSLHVKELGNFTDEIGYTSWRDDGAGNIIVELLGSPTNSGEFELNARW